MHGDTPGGPIHWRMFIPVAPERVFDALSTDAGRMTFWAESSREGDEHVDFVFANGQEYRARVVERAAPTRFVLEYFDGIASFDLHPTDDGGTDLLLTHEGVSAGD